MDHPRDSDGRRRQSHVCGVEEIRDYSEAQGLASVDGAVVTGRSTARCRRTRGLSQHPGACRYSGQVPVAAAGSASTAAASGVATSDPAPAANGSRKTNGSADGTGPSSSPPAKPPARDRAAEKRALKRLMEETFKPEARYLGAGVVAMLVSSATNLAFPTLVGKVLDRTTGGGASRQDGGEGSGGSSTSLKVFVGRTLALFLAGAVASFVRTHSLRMAKEGTARRLRKKLLRSLMRQEKAFFDGEGQQTGHHLSVLEKDVEASAEVFTTKLADGLRSLSSAVNGTTLLLRLSPKLTLVSLGLVPIFSAAIFANVMLTRRLVSEQRELEASATSFAQERLVSLTTVKAFAAEDRDLDAYSALLDRSYHLAARVSAAKGLFMGGLFFGGSGIFTAVLYYGGSLAGSGELTVGSLTSFSLYTGMVGLGFSGLSNFISDAIKAAHSAHQVFNLIDRTPRITAEGGVKPEGPCKGTIRVEGLRFAYPTRPEVEVLKGVDLEVKKGQVVALVGASGAGKSTFLALLQRLYEPVGGRVLVDGMDINTIDPSWLRTQMGLVDQEPALFSGTVQEAIRYGKPDASDFEVMSAAVEANAHDFIISFPDGYQTSVGERGRVQLSGGQKQRIALARALIKKPAILLLDEATSALDAESERLVQQAMEQAMKHRTVIVIAHRLSTIEKADKIIVLEGGRVAEVGTYSSLMANPSGAFATLHATTAQQQHSSHAI